MFVQLIQDLKIQAFTSKSVWGTLHDHPEHYQFHSQDQHERAKKCKSVHHKEQKSSKKGFFFVCV